MDSRGAIVDWLLSPEARPLLMTQVVKQLAHRLQPFVPLWRIGTGILTKHPDVAVVTIWWTPEDGVRAEDVEHGRFDSPSGFGSPVGELKNGAEDFRRIRLDRPSGYRLLDAWREAGATDYLLLRLAPQNGMFSFATRAPGGFTDAHLELLLGLRRALSIRHELSQTRHISRSLLMAYLGRNVARRVVHGEYKRGDGTQLETVVFTCDLRGFTSRVDERPLQEVLADLDLYFECVAEPWVAAGGEVIKFIGDAVLGIFPVGVDADVARAALDAARESFARLKAASAALPEGRRPLEMGYVLHAGEVMYGNIGSRTRLDFTVIGGCVNEASRMEKLTKELAPLVLSEAFVAHLANRDGLVDLGAHPLRGVHEPVQMYTAEL